MWELVIRETSTLVALKDEEGVWRPVSAGAERGREPPNQNGDAGIKDGDSHESMNQRPPLT